MARRPFLCLADDPLVRELTDAANDRQVTAEQIEAVSGISRHTWREMRDGRSKPTLASVRAIAAALGFEITLKKRKRK